MLRVFAVNLDDNISTRLVDDLSKDGVSIKKLSGISKIASFSSISGDSMIVIGEDFYIKSHLDLYKKIRSLNNNPIIFVFSEKRGKKQVEGFKSSMKLDDNMVFLSETDYCPLTVKEFHQKNNGIKTRKFPITYNDITIDIDLLSCTFEGIGDTKGRNEIILTRTEISILYYLFASEAKSSSYEDFTAIFEIQGKKINNNTLSSHIRNIKNKIHKATGKKDFIKSIYGYGYKL